MAGAWILAIDQGTTNTKALLVGREGETGFRTSAPVELLQPRPGYVEQNPLALWRSVCKVAGDCVAFAESRGAQIAGIALTNQRETAVAWRRANAGETAAGEPVMNAISWQCRRSEPVCDRLRGDAAAIQRASGLPLDPLLSATKWAWMLENQPELHKQVEGGEVCLSTVDSWLLYNMTGGAAFATDHTNASRTALMNLESLAWDDGLMGIFGVARGALPTVMASSGHFGVCTALPGLNGVPIVSVIGDSHAALVGHGRYDAGIVKATYGTGSSLMMLTPSAVKESTSLARTVAWSTASETRFALEGNIAMSGAALQWVGEFLGLQRPAEAAAALAETVSDAAGAVFVPAMVGLGAPHWDSAARGVLCNLERTHSAAHLARAAMDAIAMQVADVLDEMEKDAGTRLPALLADGGATRNDRLMQMQADAIGRPVHRSAQEDLSALGAAMLGGLTLGWWRSIDELSRLPRGTQSFAPAVAAVDRDRQRNAWRLAVRRARLGPEAAL